MPVRSFARTAALAACASLVFSLAPAVLPAVADEVVPPVATDPAPAPSPTTPAPTPAPTTPTAPTKPAKKKLTKKQQAKAKATKAAKAAIAKVKKGQYVRGRSGPNSFDCSGLMVYAYRKIGIKLAHSSRALSTRGKKISKKNLKVGDLLFFYTPVHHVGMYIGGGKFVHARNPHDDLEITKLSKYPHYRWARRILKF